MKICLALALLAGCAGSQAPIGPPAAMHFSRGKAWMLRAATSEDLVYAPGECGGTCVLSLPSLEQIGALNAGASGICSDGQGNVFLTHYDGTVTEYAHGGTTPIATLTLPKGGPGGCSVDPTSNNLAVVYDGGAVAIFANGRSRPKHYSSRLEGSNCGYDIAGNLFVSGYNLGNPAISELPKNERTFTILSVNGKLGNPGQVQWDGAEMTYEDHTDGSPISIAQLSISGSTVTVVGKTPLNGRMNYSGHSWIYDGAVLLPYGKKDDNVNKLSLYPYPAGGKPQMTFKAPKALGNSFSSVTVSIAPTH